jgi:hypothetical protein
MCVGIGPRFRIAVRWELPLRRRSDFAGGRWPTPVFVKQRAERPENLVALTTKSDDILNLEVPCKEREL